MDKPPSKESLLRQVDNLRDLARRARRLGEVLSLESDRRRLARHAEELEDSAKRLEVSAIDAKAS
jgi:hypothetical protein